MSWSSRTRTTLSRRVSWVHIVAHPSPRFPYSPTKIFFDVYVMDFSFPFLSSPFFLLSCLSDSYPLIVYTGTTRSHHVAIKFGDVQNGRGIHTPCTHCLSISLPISLISQKHHSFLSPTLLSLGSYTLLNLVFFTYFEGDVQHAFRNKCHYGDECTNLSESYVSAR